MVFRRPGARTHAFQAWLPNGRYKQLQTGAPFTAAGKALASRIEAMWTALALEHRAWDLLEPVLTARRGERAQRLGRLYDLGRRSPGTVRGVCPERRRSGDMAGGGDQPRGETAWNG